MLYVLINSRLSGTQIAVQGGHAVAQWLLDNPDGPWRNETLVYLTTPELDLWYHSLSSSGRSISTFNEPDIGGRLTAFAFYSDVEDQELKDLERLRLDKRSVCR